MSDCQRHEQNSGRPAATGSKPFCGGPSQRGCVVTRQLDPDTTVAESAQTGKANDDSHEFDCVLKAGIVPQGERDWQLDRPDQFGLSRWRKLRQEDA
jgi:hypothetical protein